MLEKTLESTLDYKDIEPVHPTGNQSWIFIGRIDAEAEAPILWPPNMKNWLIGKDRDAGKDWRQEEKGTTEDELVGWHHQLDRHEFVQASGVGDGQGSLACCSPWGRRVRHVTELSVKQTKGPEGAVKWVECGAKGRRKCVRCVRKGHSIQVAIHLSGWNSHSNFVLEQKYLSQL